jgi:hypothetical protein
MSDFEIFTGIIAALAHDINHKGLTNSYYVSKHKLGNLASISLLENMHCETLFRLIEKDDNTNILSNFDNN